MHARVVIALTVLSLGLGLAGHAFAQDTFTVQPVTVSDEKAVFATVESANVVPARARLGGTIAELQVRQGDKVERVDLFADLGLHVSQRPFDAPTAVGDGSIVPENRPLSPFGRSVVEKLAERRLLCDLSQSGHKTCLDAVRHTPRSIVISHTGCRALVDVPHNKSE